MEKPIIKPACELGLVCNCPLVIWEPDTVSILAIGLFSYGDKKLCCKAENTASKILDEHVLAGM